MKCFFVLACLAVLLAVTTASPGDAFDKCAQEATKDAAVRARINAWNMKETEADKAATKCILKGMGVLKESGELNVELFKKQLSGLKDVKFDFSAIKATNANQPTFQANFNAFIEKNRAALAKALNHPEALATKKA